MMHHTQIAQRVFNTPLMVDPAKALAFLTGLGPRITGREISVEGVEVATEAQDAEDVEAERILNILLAECSVKQAANLAAQITGRKKNALYERALQLKGQA